MNVQQKSFLNLFVVEFLQRFSYWGLLSVLVLYLNHVLHLSNQETFEIFGAFTALSFMFSIAGGFLADQFLGFRFSVISGIVVTAIGNLLLISSSLKLTYAGLSLILFGNGLFTPNISNLLGTFYEVNEPNRGRDFTLFYMSTNVGGFLGPIIYGILDLKKGWHFGFLISFIVLSAWLISFFYTKKHFKDKGLPPLQNTAKKINFYAKFCILLILTFLLLLVLLKDSELTGKFLFIIGFISLAFLCFQIKKASQKNRFALLKLVVMIFFALAFFSCEFQINSSLLIFIEAHTSRDFLGRNIPASTFAAIEPFFVIALSPFFAFLWKRLDKENSNDMLKIIAGILLQGIGFYIFAYSAYLALTSLAKIAASWMIIGNLLVGAGEICLMPTVITAITKDAPEKIKSTMMGILYLSLAFSGYLSGFIASLAVPKTSTSVDNYFHTYSNIAFITSAIAVIGMLCYLLNNWRVKIHVKNKLAKRHKKF